MTICNGQKRTISASGELGLLPIMQNLNNEIVYCSKMQNLGVIKAKQEEKLQRKSNSHTD